MSASSTIRAVASASVAAGTAAAAWGVLGERNLFTLRRGSMQVLPAGSPDITVLHLSDLHMAPWQRRKQRFVRSLAELQPDLVIDTGDNLGHVIGQLGVQAAFSPFQGVPGAFVWGSNDHWAPQSKNPFTYLGGPSAPLASPERLDTAALGRYLTGLGWADLNNRAARVVVRGVPIDLVGVDDPHREYDRLDQALPGLRGLRRRKQKAALTIGVAHAPYRRTLDALVDQGVDALFAGHTHGGQVCVPGYGALVTNCDIPRQQVKGLSRWTHGGRTADLSVSAGLGTSIYAPVRFACRPEASLITLTARP